MVSCPPLSVMPARSAATPLRDGAGLVGEAAKVVVVKHHRRPVDAHLHVQLYPVSRRDGCAKRREGIFWPPVRMRHASRDAQLGGSKNRREGLSCDLENTFNLNRNTQWQGGGRDRGAGMPARIAEGFDQEV